MPVRRTALKAEVVTQFPSHRAFLDSLSANGIQISESRFSKIITGHLDPRPEEMRHISWKLQRAISELFPEDLR